MTVISKYMKKQQILIIGGVHGNEKTGIELVQNLQSIPIKNIDSIIANPKAVEKNVRFLETDLNRSFGAKIKISHEEKIAKKLEKRIKKFDLILDFHNTNDSTNCAIVCNLPNKIQINTALYFGFDKMLIMPKSGCLIGTNAPASMSLEISEQNSELNGDYYYQKLLNFQLEKIYCSTGEQIQIFQYCGSIKKITYKRLMKKMNPIKNFLSFSEADKNHLGLEVSNIYCPIFYECGAYKDNAFHIVDEIGYLTITN